MIVSHNFTQSHCGVPQGGGFDPDLYIIYTADLPTSDNTTEATFADDISSTQNDHEIATQHLQNYLNMMPARFKKWKIQVNDAKSLHVTFTLRRDNWSPVILNNLVILQAEEAKYLRKYFDRRMERRGNSTYE